MRSTRVYVDAPLAAGARVRLPPFAADHLVRVLRLADGAAVACFNGDGRDHAAILEIGARGAVELRIGAATERRNESPLAITLVQSIARGERMDLILQKATELGVAAIAPVFADRTEVRLDGERLDKRMAHWHSVVTSACEQSGRARIPELLPARGLGEAAAALDADALKLTLDPQGEHRFETLARPTCDVVIGIGPEGGWSAKDRELLARHGFTGLRLGPRVLRTETAGLAAIAAMQARFGDL